MTLPETILQPTNDLYPLLKCCSHYKTTIEYTLHLHKSFFFKQRQVLESESNKTLLALLTLHCMADYSGFETNRGGRD